MKFSSLYDSIDTLFTFRNFMILKCKDKHLGSAKEIMQKSHSITLKPHPVALSAGSFACCFRKHTFPFSVLMCICIIALNSCEIIYNSHLGKDIRIVSYNCQNLCDARDTGNEYPEFRVSTGLWSEASYRKRLENISRAVLSYPDSVPENEKKTGARNVKKVNDLAPDILCLVEVENKVVLDDLKKGPLSRYGYKYSIMVEKNESVINNGILSRYKPEMTKVHSLDGHFSGMRYMLEVRFYRGSGKKPLTLFLCHWKSKREGIEATEPARIEAAELLKNRVSALLSEDPEALVIACGDFNESADDPASGSGIVETAFLRYDSRPELNRGLRVTDVAMNAGFNSVEPVLYSPWTDFGGYSYMYKGKKERIDGFLLSSALLDGKELEFDRFRVLNAQYLVDEEGQPRAWKGETGFSDHLPVFLSLCCDS